MVRPFEVIFDAAGQHDAMEVWIDFQAPIDDDAREGGREVMTAFSNLAAAGALSGSAINPGQSSIFVAGSRFTSHESHWKFQDVRIDPASVCILLNMIHWFHLEVAAVKNVRVVWPAIKFLPDPLVVQFPEQWLNLSFGLEVGDLLDDIDVDIEFDEPQAQEVTERIVDIMSVWLLATHRGAYADESFDPAKSAVYLGPDVMDVSSERIIWFIEIMRCNELALDGLINLLEWVHQRVARIRHIDIGP